MNIFVLNSGRCGSSTFIKSCQHIINYSSGHESKLSKLGSERLNYPNNHIEADNRLSWILGRLDETYGNDACYVHLTRNKNDTSESFAKRIDFGILKAYEQGVLMHDKHISSSKIIAEDYLQTVESNIKLFLKDKTNKIDISLENIEQDFTRFWALINAQGNLNNALKEWQTTYNAS